MRRALSWFVGVFGAICVGISLVHFVFGAASIPGGVSVNATMDSEDRFYATLFTGFGLTLIWCALDLGRRRGAFLALMGVFFFGGVARIMSVAMVGWPSPLFVFLGSLELVLPPALWLAMRQAYPAP